MKVGVTLCHNPVLLTGQRYFTRARCNVKLSVMLAGVQNVQWYYDEAGYICGALPALDMFSEKSDSVQ